MTKEVKRINFDEFGGNLATIFNIMASKKEPLLIEREGQIYRLELEQARQPEDIWSAFDTATVRHGLMRSAGALVGVDRESLLHDIYTA